MMGLRTTALPLGVDPGNGAIKLYGALGGLELPALRRDRWRAAAEQGCGPGRGQGPAPSADGGRQLLRGPARARLGPAGGEHGPRPLRRQPRTEGAPVRRADALRRAGRRPDNAPR